MLFVIKTKVIRTTEICMEVVYGREEFKLMKLEDTVIAAVLSADRELIKR